MELVYCFIVMFTYYAVSEYIDVLKIRAENQSCKCTKENVLDSNANV